MKTKVTEIKLIKTFDADPRGEVKAWLFKVVFRGKGSTLQPIVLFSKRGMIAPILIEDRVKANHIIIAMNDDQLTTALSHSRSIAGLPMLDYERAYEFSPVLQATHMALRAIKSRFGAEFEPIVNLETEEV